MSIRWFKPRPRPPQPPPPPPIFAIGIHVFSGDPTRDAKVAGARVQLGSEIGFTDGAGNIWFQRKVGEYSFSVSADGYQLYLGKVAVPSQTDYDVSLSRNYVEAVPVLRDGLLLRRVDGSIFPWRGFTSFLLAKRWMDGERDGVRDVLAQFADLGFNVARVFTQVSWNGNPGPAFYPAAYYNYDEDMSSFLAACAEYGIYVELVAHTFPYEIAAMGRHLDRISITADQHDNVFIEVANEPPDNGIDVDAVIAHWTQRTHHPWSSGHYKPTADPAGDYITHHPPRDSEWPRKAKDSQEFRDGGGPNAPSDKAYRRPVVADEPIGADETDQPGRRATSPSDFREFFAVAALTGAGATFHFQDGLNGRLARGVQLECAKAAMEGSLAIDPAAQIWNYERWDDNSLRTYVKFTGDHATVVRVRPNGPFKIRSGWVVDHEACGDAVKYLGRT